MAAWARAMTRRKSERTPFGTDGTLQKTKWSKSAPNLQSRRSLWTCLSRRPRQPSKDPRLDEDEVGYCLPLAANRGDVQVSRRKVVPSGVTVVMSFRDGMRTLVLHSECPDNFHLSCGDISWDPHPAVQCHGSLASATY